MKRTPGPWKAEPGYVGAKHRVFVTHPTQDGFLPWSDADAEFIVCACNAHEDLVEAVQETNRLIRKAQDILCDYLIPDGDADTAISALLELLDGPEQREIQKKAQAAVAKAKGESDA